MWDDRYSEEEYVYGTDPNSFLVEHVDMLTGPVLSIAEGEGRNAVFLASQGLDVIGVDASSVGLKKAQLLAKTKAVQIQTKAADLNEYKPKENYYGSVISIFAHLPNSIRQKLYPLIERSLKPGGIFLLEAYSENQLAKETGGPKDLDMLMSKSKIEREFSNLEPVILHEIDREVREGRYHTGLASVIQFIGKKPNY